jgi:Uma2 family endonuclease
MLQTMLDPDALVPDAIRRLSRREYDKLVELGVFADERIELLRGMLVTMAPQGGPHATIAGWLSQWLALQLGMAFDVRGHSPYAASDDSEPEPDISISRRVTGVLEHPSAALLLIEVAQSSIRKDRQVKAAIYAEAGVPEYWIVDISGGGLIVEVFTQPAPHGYRRVDTLRDGDILRPTRLPGVELPVLEIPWDR